MNAPRTSAPPARRACHAWNAHGFTLPEVLIAAVIFLFVAIAAGSMYLSARRGFDLTTAESFLQRQGTLIEERLTSELKSANSVQVTPCREIDPTSSPAMGANKSIVYTRFYPLRVTNQTETWCVYEYQRSAFSAFPQLWRCPLAGAASTICTGGATNAENLLPPVPSSVAGQRVEVTNTIFCPTGISPCTGATPVARSVDIRFQMNLYPSNTSTSLLYGPRTFGFSMAYRN
jgi:prepilin-type N-terminal cleavage/methylation domain-containing protein